MKPLKFTSQLKDTMKEKTMIALVDKQFKTINNLSDADKIKSFDLILGKVNQLVVTAVLSLQNSPVTDKKKKKEQSKFNMAVKVEKETLKNKELLANSSLSELTNTYLSNMEHYRKIIG